MYIYTALHSMVEREILENGLRIFLRGLGAEKKEEGIIKMAASFHYWCVTISVHQYQSSKHFFFL